MNLSELIQAVYSDLGMSETFLATGGSTTTVVNSNIGDLEEQPDDDYAIDYTAIVATDSAGAGAAPEGEFARVSDYVASTWTYTIGTLTAAVASGDEVMLCTNEIPLREMIRAANRGLQEIGPVPAAPNKSLTSASDQTEYTLPAAITYSRIRSVEYQENTADSNDNQWIPIPNYHVEIGTYGSTGTLYIPQIPSGRTIKIVYDGIHSKLTAYNSEIAPTLTEPLLIEAATKYALRWYVGTNEGGDSFWLQRYNEVVTDFERELIKWRSFVDMPKVYGRYALYGQSQYRYYPGDQSIYDR